MVAIVAREMVNREYTQSPNTATIPNPSPYVQEYFLITSALYPFKFLDVKIEFKVRCQNVQSQAYGSIELFGLTFCD
jgi:hypothetical protein